MKPIYIFRHIECEGPGYLDTVLARNDIPSQLFAIDRGDALPTTIDECSALVFMGGSMSVNDDLHWLHQEFALIRQARERNMPMLGHCLGGQLISKALGGEVIKNKVKEIGWHAVKVADNSAARQWFEGLPGEFTAFHWHGETFSLPKGAQLLLSNTHCTNQAFALGNILGWQCHIEMTEELVRTWVLEYKDEIAHPTANIQSAEGILGNLATHIHSMQIIADTLYQRWLSHVTH